MDIGDRVTYTDDYIKRTPPYKKGEMRPFGTIEGFGVWKDPYSRVFVKWDNGIESAPLASIIQVVHAIATAEGRSPWEREEGGIWNSLA